MIKTIDFLIMHIMCDIYDITESSKRPRLEQIPAANLDADDPIDDVSH